MKSGASRRSTSAAAWRHGTISAERGSLPRQCWYARRRCALWALRSRRKYTAIAALLAGTLGSWNLVFGYLHALDANFSSERLIESLTGERQAYRTDAPFYTLEQFDPSVPFYLKRTLTLVNTRGERIDTGALQVVRQPQRRQQERRRLTGVRPQGEDDREAQD